MLGPTGWYASKASSAPAPATICSSEIVAALKLRIPAASCMRTTSGILYVFTCGRKRNT